MALVDRISIDAEYAGKEQERDQDHVPASPPVGVARFVTPANSSSCSSVGSEASAMPRVMPVIG